MRGDSWQGEGRVSRQAGVGHHTVLILDGAGWHQPGNTPAVPENVSVLHLRPVVRPHP